MDSKSREAFRTLRGFVAGEANEELLYFHLSATLRIHGDGVPFDEISRLLGVEPTHSHRKGEQRRQDSVPYREDAWHLRAPLSETEPLQLHLDALWQIVEPQVAYLKALKEQFWVDVFCGYRSNCDIAGFEISHQCLRLFTALEIPFGVSVIVTPD